MEVEDQPGEDLVTAAVLTTAFVLGATARGATARGVTVGAVRAGVIIALTAGFTLEASDPPLATDSTGAIISGTGGVRLVACDTPAVRFGTGVGSRPSVGIATGGAGAIVGGASAIALPLPGPSPPVPVTGNLRGLGGCGSAVCKSSYRCTSNCVELTHCPVSANTTGSQSVVTGCGLNIVLDLPAGFPIVARKSANASPGVSPALTLVW
jgi:hypothetical protein